MADSCNRCYSDPKPNDLRGAHAIIRPMTKLLTKVLRQIEDLPEERQDDVAHVVLAMLENDAIRYELSDEQLRELDQRIADADAGKFATDKEIDAALHRPWA